MDDVRIGVAQRGDHAAVLELLRASDLPTEGLDACWGAVLIARVEESLAGTAALEHHGPDAVLRSLAVAARYRGLGIGETLVRHALDSARSAGVRGIYLLTETAAEFFPRFGFREMPREQAPESILGSIEYRSLCPSSAASMVLRLDDGA